MTLDFKKEALTGFLFFGLSAAICLSGCASVDPSEYRQTVLVTSQPAGAEVYDHGKLVGITPAYVRVRRSVRAKLTFVYPENPPNEVKLQTHYRWGDSFGTNFILTTFAPIGWVADLLTGNAWRLDDPPAQKFSGKPVPNVGGNTIAIAPPQAVDTETSDAIGILLDKKVEDLRIGRLLPYADTAREFDYYGSDQGLTKNLKRRYNLFYQLRADKILLSKAEARDDGFFVTGHFYNVYTGQEGKAHVWQLWSEDGSLKDQLKEHSYFQSMFHWFPNTLYLNLGDYTPNLSIDNSSFRGSSATPPGFLNQAASYISFFGLGHIERPRYDVKAHFTFDFVPTLFYSRKKIRFDDYQPLEGAVFDRTYINAGYGIEVGHLSRIGFFYLDVVPSLNWTQIRVTSPDVVDTTSGFAAIVVEELGYSVFVGDHIVLKLFVREVTEDTNQWARSIHTVTGSDEAVTGALSSMAGLAIGYYIPSSLNKKRNWKAVELP